jgi:signal transduction histidine kinase
MFRWCAAMAEQSKLSCRGICISRLTAASVTSGYLRDVTEKRRNERVKRQLDLQVKLIRQRELAQVGLYVTGIAHNLRNPIHIIQNHIALLLDKGVNYPELNIALEYSQNLNAILENLLDKIRLERDPEPQDIDVNQLIQREMKFLEANMFFKHDVEKEFNYDPQLPPIKGIYGDFSQAIMNIVYNALDAMRQSSEKRLILRTAYDSDLREIKISITDTGEGIPEKFKSRIFEPFFSTKASSSDKLKNGLSAGSGLGLSSAKTLLEAYQGRITQESEPGVGTTFFITFPLVKEGGES